MKNKKPALFALANCMSEVGSFNCQVCYDIALNFCLQRSNAFFTLTYSTFKLLAMLLIESPL
ncbi:hypothetical protein, partial [Jeotgalibaca porci]|uniref:hypothetical protein n=1 Tax=Jeotgalibaca porci TaxID=1868793 RepID=UPI0035A07930